MTVTVALPFTLINGTVADATQVMANFNSLVTGFTQAASAGANSDITALNGLITPITPAQGGSNVFIGTAVAGTANAITVGTTTPANFTFTQGYGVTFIPVLSNLGPATLTVLATGAQTITKIGSSGILPIAAGDIQIGSMAYLLSDGTKYILLNPANDTGGFGQIVGVAVVGTTADLGVGAPSHLAAIFGGTITSFGSSANIAEPHYLVKFGAVTNITYNAVSLITPSTASITAQANDVAELIYLGGGNWQIINFARASGAAVVSSASIGSAVNFLGITNTGTPTLFAYSFSSATMVNPVTGISFYSTGATGTLNLTTGTTPGVPVADGMDGNARPVSSFGFMYLISNGTLTNAIVSASAVAPALPGGYIYFHRVGAIPFNGAGNMHQVTLSGQMGSYNPTAGTTTTAYPVISNSATPAWPTAFPLTGIAPATAGSVRIVAAGDTNNNVTLGASTGTTGIGSFARANPPLFFIATIETFAETVEIPIVGALQILYGNNAANATISIAGWRDKVNAS